jgi:transcriptional regulator with XRE-family HTH domain
MNFYMKNLRAMRVYKSKWQKEVSGYLKVPRDRYSQYERGLRPMPFELVEKCSTYFDVPTDVLLVGSIPTETECRAERHERKYRLWEHSNS